MIPKDVCFRKNCVEVKFKADQFYITVNTFGSAGGKASV